MAWIDEIDEAQATGVLAMLYDVLVGERGKVANIMKAQSLNPAAMKAHLDLYMTLAFRHRGGLSREECEVLGTAVAAANRCDYCRNHHARGLGNHWEGTDAVEAFADDPAGYTLPQRQRAMVDFALELTLRPAESSCDAVQSLRTAGLDDAEILNVVLLTGYFNFANRIALALGVAFTEDEVSGYHD